MQGNSDSSNGPCFNWVEPLCIYVIRTPEHVESPQYSFINSPFNKAPSIHTFKQEYL